MQREIKAFGTCSVDHPRDNHLTFATNEVYYRKAVKSGRQLQVIIPEHSAFSRDGSFAERQTDSVVDIRSNNPEYDFVIFHNAINRNSERKFDKVAPSAKVHHTASIGNEGMRYVRSLAAGYIVSMRHMGGVVLKVDVVVGAHSSIACATLDYTVINADVKIGCGCQIGHNAKIGMRTLVIDGVVVLGSAKIGADCYIGGGAVIRGGITIPDKTLIGMGSVVTKSIDKPGIYFGNPAKYHGEWDGVWPS